MIVGRSKGLFLYKKDEMKKKSPVSGLGQQTSATHPLVLVDAVKSKPVLYTKTT